MRQGKKWTGLEEIKLLELILDGLDCDTIAHKMGRSKNSVISKAQRKGWHKKTTTFRPNEFTVDIEPFGYSPSIHWRKHPVHTNYYVSDTGLVWSAIHGKELKQYRLTHKTMKKKGLWVSITRDGKTGAQTKVSRLVAETWLNLLPEQVVVHKNRNKDDNDLENLLILNKKELGKATGYLSKAFPVGRYNNSGVLVKKYRSVRSAAKDIGVNYQTLLDHLNGKTKVNKYQNYKYLKQKE